MHEWTEKIQSSPHAIERSVYEVIGKEYRSSRVTLIELRFNPMKRNVGGERDLDHIIHAALRGMDRAVLEYGVRAGLIFCLAREFKPELNEIIVEKAIRYRKRGVVGIDLAGTEKNAIELQPAEVAKYRDLYARARAAGLKTTVHTGETAGTGAEGVRAVVEQLQPHRIGHGIRAAQDPAVMDLLRERDIVLEICPSSNLQTRAIASLDELKEILTTLWSRNVKFTLNTDGPYLLDTNLRREVELMRNGKVLSEEQIEQTFRWAREYTFLESQ
jgi:adenosine deaminase